MRFFTHKKITLLHKIKHPFSKKNPDNWFVQKFNSIASRYGLPFGIFLAIFAALILTAISMTLYFISDTAKLDLSRPGYESVRKQINRDESSNDNFSANGSIDASVIKDFNAKYDKRAKSLNQYDQFDQNILDDTHIGIVDQQIAPNDGANQ